MDAHTSFEDDPLRWRSVILPRTRTPSDLEEENNLVDAVLRAERSNAKRRHSGSTASQLRAAKLKRGKLAVDIGSIILSQALQCACNALGRSYFVDVVLVSFIRHTGLSVTPTIHEDAFPKTESALINMALSIGN